MRGWLALLVCASCASCGDDAPGLFLDLSSTVTPLDRATVSVFGAHGAIIRGQELSDDGDLDLPREVRIDGGERAETVRILVWGERGGERVAFGATSASLRPGERDERALKLEAPMPDCDADGVPNAFDGCLEIADPEQADADADGTTDACTPGASCPANRVGNGDFEETTMGWMASSVDPARINRTSGGHTSAFALEVCKNQTTGMANQYAMDDRPPWIGTPLAGTRYRVDAWVRSMSAQNIDLRLGELTLAGSNPVPGTQIGTVQGPNDWTVITATYQATGAAGTTELDIRFRVLSGPDGSCFQLDDVCAQELVAACP